ncbi:MAG: oxidoreductase [Sinobacteraceae bacterium]|nr:oxidoreductase [Nevskiaceae bacterium]MBV9317914.1 oxidoreductase [Gammaproteobacteria bacterium]
MKRFEAFRIHSQDGKIVARFEELGLDELSAGDVLIRVTHSGINYKDALAATGAGKILRRYPLVGGIDLAGIVESSGDARFVPGSAVLVTGCGLSETHDGGYAQFARVPGDWVIPMPPGLDAFTAMAIGTAGFTAALAVHRMEQNGQEPAGGPIAVTGASGGVGSLAIDMLSARGYRVVAVSGKAEAIPYLKELGADEVLLRERLDLGTRPLETARFGGAIDNVGGETLTWLTRTVDFWGNIASIGLASGAELRTTVMPFILRGVALLGINSSATRREWRLAVWQRIATDLRPRHLERIATRTIDFHELPGAFPAYLAAGVTGRTVVRIG